MKINALLAGGAGLVLALAPTVTAQEADAAKYLEALSSLSQKSYECDMDMKMTLETPMEMNMALKGHMIYGDPSHMRMNMDMSMVMPMAEEPMNMTMLMVLDGETMWMDMNMDMSAMGAGNQRQVMKIPASSLAEMAKMGGGMGMNPMGMGGSDMDPVAQAKKFLELYQDLEVKEDGDLVTLSGRIDMAKLEEAIGDQPMPFDLSNVTMVIDQKLGFPVAMTMGDDENTIMEMKMTNVKFHEEIPEEKFKFVPPDDVPVIDLGMMMPQAGGADDEDF